MEVSSSLTRGSGVSVRGNDGDTINVAPASAAIFKFELRVFRMGLQAAWVYFDPQVNVFGGRISRLRRASAGGQRLSSPG